MNRYFDQLLNLIYPPVCALCDVDIDEEHASSQLCDRCRPKFEVPDAHRCRKCAARVAETFQGLDCPWCSAHDLRFDRTFTLGTYDGALREAVLLTKRRGHENAVGMLAERFWQRHGAALQQERIDLVFPVPMHWQRFLVRGHNGPELLATWLAGKLRAGDRSRSLFRCRRTMPQVGLSVPQRRDNVHNAFALRRLVRIAGRRILLVDDVLTSGATCSEAARTLKRAGAATVVVAVLARAQGET